MLTPPTDSFYKFTAIFGLVLIVTGYVPEQQFEQSFNEALIAYNTKLDTEAEHYYDRKSELITQLVMREKLNETDAEKNANILNQLKILDEKFSAFWRKNLGTETETRRPQFYELAEKRYRDALSRSLFLRLGGGILAVIGFFLWYTKIQRYLDVSIRAQAEREHTLPTPRDLAT